MAELAGGQTLRAEDWDEGEEVDEGRGEGIAEQVSKRETKSQRNTPPFFSRVFLATFFTILLCKYIARANSLLLFGSEKFNDYIISRHRIFSLKKWSENCLRLRTQ